MEHKPGAAGIAGAIVQSRRGQAVVAQALELLPELGQFSVMGETGVASAFAPERFAATVRRACQAGGVHDEALSAEAACVALLVLKEQVTDGTVSLATLHWATSEALLALGLPEAAVAAARGKAAVGTAARVPRQGDGLALVALPLAAVSKGDARLLERSLVFAERVAGLATAAGSFRDERSRGAFIDAAAKLGAASAWEWAEESAADLVTFAPLSTVPRADGRSGELGGGPSYPVPTCRLRLATFLAEDGVRAEALLAAVEVALVAADAQTEAVAAALPLVRGAAAGLRHVRIELDATGATVAAPVQAALDALVRGRLVVGSARLAVALGAYRAWPLNHKLALRLVGRERDRLTADLEGVPPELAERVRQVWNEALELAMAHGLRNAGLYGQPPAAEIALPAREPQQHRFAVRGVPGAIWVTFGAGGRPAAVTVRCGEPRSATGLILSTASAGMTAALRRGASLAEAAAPYVGSSFPPRGATGDPAHPEAASPLDYAARWLTDFSVERVY